MPILSFVSSNKLILENIEAHCSLGLFNIGICKFWRQNCISNKPGLSCVISKNLNGEILPFSPPYKPIIVLAKLYKSALFLSLEFII